MARIKWTEAQRKTIELRDANVLISAAAGAGKTAVLIERIFNRIMDKKDPVDVDRFLVVTFTRAAAAQMKERLRLRIEEELEKKPDDPRLQRQSALVASAHVSTVHGFCRHVIQNYFHRIGLDPDFQQGTDKEIEMLKRETLDAILEEEYTECREDFVELAEMNRFQRSDERLPDMVLEIYDRAMSNPFPEDWLDQMEAFLSVRSADEWEKSSICESLLKETREIAGCIAEEAVPLKKQCQEPEGPYYYEEKIEELEKICESLQAARDYNEMYNVMSGMSFSNMRSKKDESVREEKKEAVMAGRNRCKDVLKDLRDRYFYQGIEEHLSDLDDMGKNIRTLLRLTRRFLAEFTEAKRDRGIVDYNDLEQLALSILLVKDEKTGERVRSAAAEELAGQFAEIMIDEYQDSNQVQDTLLWSVSRDGMAGMAPNLFMVGDVKQSIYRFRNACPELFSDKLSTYRTEEGAACRRVDLHQNFRSREMILEGCNRVFGRIMREDIGGVEYDESAALRAGREFPESPYRSGGKNEAYVLTGEGDAESEGRLIASRIKELVGGENPLYILDGEQYRKASYHDIVVLTRSVKAVGQSYFDALTDAGIPVVMERSQGFFDTREIQIMVNMLQVIDNPRQDIPLAAVLVSPMFRFSEEELALIRGTDKEKYLYEVLCSYSGEDTVREKAREFLRVLDGLRRKISYAAVAELIQDIYDKTGIYDFVRMMRDGAKRTANMDSLMEQARAFDGTTYHGLYQFVRYINRIREQKEDMGEANLVGEEEDVVRIMTIHKSKGLEFPVCILAGMGRNLFRADKSLLTIRPELGIMSKIVYNKTGTIKNTIYDNYGRHQNHMDDLGEELRILYVAMTRAQEKLIMTGCAQELQSAGTNYLSRSSMKCFLDMVLPAVLEEPDYFEVTPVTVEELTKEAAVELLTEKLEEEALNNFDTSVVYDKRIHECLGQMEQDVSEEPEPVPVKVSVSELKIKSMEEMDVGDFTILSHDGKEDEKPVPAFMREPGETSEHRGAAYGTVWHQVMAEIDFARTETEEEIREAVEELVRTGRLREEEMSLLNYRRLHSFFSSRLGKEMRRAADEGRLHREQPFVFGKPADEVFEGREEKDTVLIQGIIDGYYEKEDGIVLMDYKTDSLADGEEQALVDRYQTQMTLYKEALEAMTGQPVRECVLYSFSLSREIPCSCS